MKNMNQPLYLTKFVSWVILTLFISGNISSQVKESGIMLHDGYNEKYAVFTDRSLYIAGEKLYFSVFNISDKIIREAFKNKVFYIELIKSNGDVVTDAKFSLSSEGTQGYITIPEDVATGYYFICSYTRWMRNFSREGYAYNRIKVINPGFQETGNTFTGVSDPSYTLKSLPSVLSFSTVIECKTNKTTYGIREKACVSVSVPAFLKNTAERYCITVARPGAHDGNRMEALRTNGANGGTNSALQYIPENKGLSVTGQVVFKQNSQPAVAAMVQLAVLGNYNDYLTYLTGSDGRFYFSLLPFSGKQDLFISARNAADDQLEIRVDKDFANHSNTLYTGSFFLDEKERGLVLEMMINAQVNKAYEERSDTSLLHIKSDSDGLSFYGQPLKTVYIDEFIALPTLGEVFFELVHEVNISKKKGAPYMVLTGHAKNNADLASYNPLILIDRIPISDLNDLLEISPDRIQRIELINDMYIRGNIIYGGILSIFSKKGDLAGIKLPRNSFFFDLNGYYSQESDEYKACPYSLADMRIPDLRNCLYWNPEVNIRSGEETSLEFYTSDSQGEFEVVIRGLTGRGDVIEGRCKFSVK